MRKKVAALLTVSLLAVSLAGCSGGSDKPASGGEAQAEEKKMTEYSTVYTAEIDTLNYLKTTNSDSIALFYNILDGLVEFDRFGEMIPCIAEKWEVSDDELTYTFHLRDDAKWYDWKGNEVRNVKAQDFVDGKLVPNTEALCNHHHHDDGHSCASHTCGSGGCHAH